MPRPELEEQVRIGTTFGALDSRISSEREYLSALRHEKSALMSVLLTGELRVTPDEAAP